MKEDIFIYSIILRVINWHMHMKIILDLYESYRKLKRKLETG